MFKTNNKGFIPEPMFFINFKSIYNNVNLDILFDYIIQKNKLEREEVLFLKLLYMKTKLTIGKEKVKIYKGLMQGLEIIENFHYLKKITSLSG